MVWTEYATKAEKAQLARLEAWLGKASDAYKMKRTIRDRCIQRELRKERKPQ